MHVAKKVSIGDMFVLVEGNFDGDDFVGDPKMYWMGLIDLKDFIKAIPFDYVHAFDGESLYEKIYNDACEIAKKEVEQCQISERA
jgi:hypothetical protein